MFGHAVEVFRKLELGTGEADFSFLTRGTQEPGKLVRM